MRRLFQDRLPIRSALLTETSDKDLEEFFRSGWVHMALPHRESSIQRPWDPSPWDGDLEAYREDLYAGMAFGMSDVRAFAREWLEELLRVGYFGMEESLDLPFKQRSGDFSSPPKALPASWVWQDALRHFATIDNNCTTGRDCNDRGIDLCRRPNRVDVAALEALGDDGRTKWLFRVVSFGPFHHA